MSTYYKRHGHKAKSNEKDLWGSAIWYIEINEDRYPIRKVELYANGNRLKYHTKKTFDDYGKLGDQPLDLDEWVKIEQKEFELAWEKSNPKKEHQEILNLISNYLANHYDQRFGQALFNLGVNEFKNRTDPSKENYQMREAHLIGP